MGKDQDDEEEERMLELTQARLQEIRAWCSTVVQANVAVEPEATQPQAVQAHDLQMQVLQLQPQAVYVWHSVVEAEPAQPQAVQAQPPVSQEVQVQQQALQVHVAAQGVVPAQISESLVGICTVALLESSMQ